MPTSTRRYARVPDAEVHEHLRGLRIGSVLQRLAGAGTDRRVGTWRPVRANARTLPLPTCESWGGRVARRSRLLTKAEEDVTASDLIRFPCDLCGKRLGADPEMTMVICPVCRTRNDVPAASVPERDTLPQRVVVSGVEM